VKKKIKRIKEVVKPADELTGHHGWEGRKCWGRAQALYIFRRKASGASRFLKIGEYCVKCGGIHVYKTFKAGISYEDAKIIDGPDVAGTRPLVAPSLLSRRLHGRQ